MNTEIHLSLRNEEHERFLEVYRVRGALQEEVDGSVDVLIAVMERYHAFILVLPRHLHQLGECRGYTHKGKQSATY